ncbi:Protein CBR-CEC-2 [Caenorhabditis briggsae]|uniref:Protein CBR-CEC-2 n=1 Tax=Caenorhabditis briggsae TaxID=6238 RepID=A8XDZ9_CAEBR|nr:Protein CBR-CEC-2 [Caenorhabditis briggsae]CAP30805.2 Protein CBR-CEC-2 [Caenorhabditis briggsae]
MAGLDTSGPLEYNPIDKEEVQGEEEEDVHTWEVKKITKAKFKDEQLSFLVIWDIDRSLTWEPLESFSGGLQHERIRNFAKKNPQKWAYLMKKIPDNLREALLSAKNDAMATITDGPDIDFIEEKRTGFENEQVVPNIMSFKHFENLENVKNLIESLTPSALSGKSEKRRRHTKAEMKAMSVIDREELRKTQNRVCSANSLHRKKEKIAENREKINNLKRELAEIRGKNHRFFENSENFEKLKLRIFDEIERENSGKKEEFEENIKNLKIEIAGITLRHQQEPQNKSTLAAQKCRKNLNLRIAEMEFSGICLEIELQKELKLESELKKAINFDEEKSPLEQILNMAEIQINRKF